VPLAPQTAYCLSYVPLMRGQPGVNQTDEIRRHRQRLA
jgi:hypothetical protein